ncbi:MAG: methionyl-tRNA formyltransferase [Candidatus Omnitrophica bacterium]|nr:methionyl-tRNA formyltransferase [Candidatus Omnitrophota bacterium]
MKIVFFGSGERAFGCLNALCEKKHDILLVVTDKAEGVVRDLAAKNRLECVVGPDPNEFTFREKLKKLRADLFVMAAYGKIMKKGTIDIPRLMTVNLHGGKLSGRRGSSPMNWALIENADSFTLSIIKVDEGIDTGDILSERTFAVSGDDTIVDLHKIANEQFPKMLVEVIEKIANNTHKMVPQDNSKAAYYPLRFPDDGLILFDMRTAHEAHERLRALTRPYPCAFTFFKGRKVLLIASKRCETPHFGEPGRIYKKTSGGILVSAKDKCLWITKAEFEDTGASLFDGVKRYDILASAAGTTLELLKSGRAG